MDLRHTFLCLLLLASLTAAIGCGDDGDASPDTCTEDDDCTAESECRVGVCDEGSCVFEDDDALCADPGPCATGVCTDEGCTSEPLTDGTPCGDDDAFECLDGDCVGCSDASDCADGIDCTSDVCDDGTCLNPPNDDFCDDDNECTAATCDPTEGCVFDTLDGEPCSDGQGTCEGDSCEVGPGAEAFRLDTLAVEHPHFILDASSGGMSVCDDVTFEDTSFVDGLNPTLEERIESLEFNLALVFDPFDQTEGFTGDAALVDSDCDSETECEPSEKGEFGAAGYDIERSGTCLDNIPGIFAGTWPDGRLSTPNQPSAGDHGCFVTEEIDTLPVELQLGDSSFELHFDDARLAARFASDPADTLEEGVLTGFLTEANAQDITIDVSTPAGTVSVNLAEDLLPDDGASGPCEPRTHCDGPDARVTHEGVCGWWFALNFTAERLESTDAY